MKKQTARLVLFLVFGSGAASSALAQISIQPTSPPTVTAENESWYVTNEAVLFAGNPYYPAGPSIHFLPNEMVLSGFFRGVPLYTRTTIEPYSIVFVPIAGGLMRPYERRRAGDLAGTTGSSAPSLPVEMPSALSPSTRIQAAGPPFAETQGVVSESPSTEMPPTSPTGGALDDHARAVSTLSGTGTVGRLAASRTSKRVGPVPANSIYVEFNNQRWYSSPAPASLDPGTLRRVGEWHGFPVFTSPTTGPARIYIPVAQGSDAYAAYTRK
ncbi:MAG: hypothetical protein ACJ731_14045 [Vicinamibacterales bacterium]